MEQEMTGLAVQEETSPVSAAQSAPEDAEPKSEEEKKKDIKKKAIKAGVAVVASASVLVGGLFSSPDALLAPEQDLNPVPISQNDNDNDQDGHDVSWIWDAHFERLNDPSVKTIVCSGTRPYDMALRLKYEGLEDRVMVIENARDAIRWLDEANLESHVISTYTALHSTRAVLRKQEGRHHK